MSTRDQLHAAVDRLPDDRLEALLSHVRWIEKEVARLAAPSDGPSLMELLLSIKIDGLPADFSENLHDYLYQGKPYIVDATDSPPAS